MSQGSLNSYANTSVSAGRTKEQIEALLQKVGAVGFQWLSNLPYTLDGERIGGFDQLTAAICWHDRQQAFQLRVEWDDERRQRQNLRALYWYLKAKIEAIQFGIVDLEREFLPYLLARSGRTVYDELGGSDIRLLPSGEEEA